MINKRKVPLTDNTVIEKHMGKINNPFLNNCGYANQDMKYPC